MAAHKDRFGCLGELSWLVRGVELKQFRTCLTYASFFSFFCPRLRKNANTTQSSMKFGNIVLVETSRYLIKIMTLRKKADRKQRRSLRLSCTAGGNQARLKCTEFETYGGGVEAGHAHGCSLDSSQTVSEETKYLGDLKHHHGKISIPRL